MSGNPIPLEVKGAVQHGEASIWCLFDTCASVGLIPKSAHAKVLHSMSPQTWMLPGGKTLTLTQFGEVTLAFQDVGGQVVTLTLQGPLADEGPLLISHNHPDIAVIHSSSKGDSYAMIKDHKIPLKTFKGVLGTKGFMLPMPAQGITQQVNYLPRPKHTYPMSSSHSTRLSPNDLLEQHCSYGHPNPRELYETLSLAHMKCH